LYIILQIFTLWYTLARLASLHVIRVSVDGCRAYTLSLESTLFISCQPHSGTSSSISDSPIPSPKFTCHYFLFCLPLYSAITLFRVRLKTYCFTNSAFRSFISSFRTAFADYCVDRFFLATRFLFVLIFLVSVPCARLSWLSPQL